MAKYFMYREQHTFIIYDDPSKQAQDFYFLWMIRTKIPNHGNHEKLE